MLTFASDAEPIRIRRIENQGRIRRHKGFPGDRRNNSAALSKVIAGPVCAADDAFLNPLLTRFEKPVFGEAGELCRTSCATGGTVICSARAKNKVAAVRRRGPRRSEEFDVIDPGTPGAGNPVLFERVTDFQGQIGERSDIRRRQINRTVLDQEEPVPAPWLRETAWSDPRSCCRGCA